jgi:hypothetical protein
VWNLTLVLEHLLLIPEKQCHQTSIPGGGKELPKLYPTDRSVFKSNRTARMEVESVERALLPAALDLDFDFALTLE